MAHNLLLPSIVTYKNNVQETDVTEEIHRIGVAPGGLVSVLDPDAIVLGGGLSGIDELYTFGAGKMRQYAFHGHVGTPVLKNELGVKQSREVLQLLKKLGRKFAASITHNLEYAFKAAQRAAVVCNGRLDMAEADHSHIVSLMMGAENHGTNRT